MLKYPALGIGLLLKLSLNLYAHSLLITLDTIYPSLPFGTVKHNYGISLCTYSSSMNVFELYSLVLVNS